MGLRETKARRTHDKCVDAAVDLFASQGFDLTTMEQVAARAEVSTSTLYRYFPTKEDLVIEPLVFRGQLASRLTARPEGEPLAEALGNSLVDLLVAPRADQARLSQILAIIDSASGPRARLLEAFSKERSLLEAAVTTRMGRPDGDIYCIATARLAMVVLEMITQRTSEVSDDPVVAAGQVRAVFDRIVAALDEEPPTVPRPRP